MERLEQRRSAGRCAGAQAALWLALAAGAPAGLAQDAAPVAVVAPAPIERGAALRFTGTLTAARSAALSPRVGGLVTAVNVDAGDRARQGEVLLTLDSTMVALELRRAEAAVDEALFRLEEAQRLRDEADALSGTIPQTTLRARAAQVSIEEAALARLDAERRMQAELIARHQLLAPFDGVVAAKLAEVGEWVEPGDAVLSFVATERLRLDVQLPQEHYNRIATGAEASVRLDALPGHEFPGRIAAKVPVSDPTARTFLVRVELDNPSGEMIAGMSAEVAFRLAGAADALALPRDALKRYPDGTVTVWIVLGEGNDLHATERPVRIGRTISETVEVLDGLEAGARVVVRGNEVLQEGQAVRVVDETAMR